MRDPFNAPVAFNSADRHAGNELTRTNVTSSVGDYGLPNGNAKPLAPNSDSLVRHQLEGASLHNDLIGEDPNSRFMDPETKELYLRSRSQEEEILLLRKKIADACAKELQLLNEKHILERKLADLRMAVDEKQEDAISGALRQLNQKKDHLEENMKLADQLKVQEEEVYFFTSSLLSLLAEYDVRPPQISASTITAGTKRLYQQMQWKIRSLNDSLGDITRAGNLYNPSQPGISDMPAGHSDGRLNGDDGRDDSQPPSRHENEGSSVDGDIPLPGIDEFQIVGEPKPGFTLTACGFPLNGTTLCNFQWVRCLDNGTRQSIEGATMFDYVVTADDIGTLLAVDCTPMDDNGRQGELVRAFANNQNKITCDPEMQHEIDMFISSGRALFNVLILVYSSDEWEPAILMLKRSGYQIKLKRTEEVVVEEKYSPNLQTKVPYGRSTQFVLVSSVGVNVPFNTQDAAEPNSEDDDVRLRDLIVLVMRTFQNKALDAKRKGKA